MSEYTVRGQFQTHGGWSPFEKRTEAPNEDVAVEHVYSEMGSEHRLKRTQVEIQEVEA